MTILARPRAVRCAERPTVQPLARLPVLTAMGALAVVLSVFSDGYGFHRDELYFRMLKPAWGYVDQGPLTPWLVRLFAFHVADEPWAIRIPATVAAVASVLVVVLITRELGGGRGAQTLCAWAYAFATAPLVFGHVMLTSSLDLVVWPLTTLFIMRAVLRADPRWWIAAGVVVGLSMYNKLLIAMLLVAFVIGLALVGPRSVFRSPWPIGSALIALVIGAPNIIYQATHSWPEIAMGQALAANNAGDVRTEMWPFLVILYGPPLTVFWICGVVALWRRFEWRPVRFVAVSLPVMLVLVFVAGTQFYYPSGLLAVLIAAGCVPVAGFVRRSRPWLVLVVAGVAVNCGVSLLLALPVVPLTDVGATAIPAVNQTAQDSVGWPTYVTQIARVYGDLPPATRQRTAVVTSNYGEAGALARYGPAHGITAVYSGHNQLYFDARPPDRDTVAVVVGGQLPTFRRDFRSCQVEARLHDGVGVVNEEQGQPVAVCRTPRESWTAFWPTVRHYD